MIYYIVRRNDQDIHIYKKRLIYNDYVSKKSIREISHVYNASVSI